MAATCGSKYPTWEVCFLKSLRNMGDRELYWCGVKTPDPCTDGNCTYNWMFKPLSDMRLRPERMLTTYLCHNLANFQARLCFGAGSNGVETSRKSWLMYYPKKFEERIVLQSLLSTRNADFRFGKAMVDRAAFCLRVQAPKFKAWLMVGILHDLTFTLLYVYIYIRKA